MSQERKSGFQPELEIGGAVIGPMHPAYIIAEIGPNHDGSAKTAERLIDAARDAGCDAVKFQYHRAEAEIFDRTTKSYYFNETRYEFIRRVQEFPHPVHQALRERTWDRGLGYLCSVFSEETAAAVIDLRPDAIKIPSGEVGNPWLLETVGKSGIPVIASSGMSPLEEIDAMMETLGTVSSQVALLHCVSEYPTALEDMNLRMIPTLAERYGCPVGLSDHSRRFAQIATSIALGARLIEVHFTFDRTLSGPDHHVSLTPEEMAHLVGLVRDCEKALGRATKEMGPHASEMRESFTNSIVARRHISPGDILSRENITLKKPGTGLAPSHLGDILGRRARSVIPLNSLIKLEDIE